MRFLPTAELLFLDFDGVLCDSLEECFRSSWLTSAGVEISEMVPPDPPFDGAYRTRFNAARPFIRSGEDYVLVHEWAAQGKVPRSQAEFDASLAAKGPEQMAEWKRKLYAVRDLLLVHHRALWLSWNPLYPGIAGALASQADNPSVWILSTKKAEFIVEILAHHGAPWPLARTLYTGPRRKLDMIEEQAGVQGSELIDDQVDHLDFKHPRCRCYLALWGYIAPDAASRAADSLSLAAAVEKVSGFPRPLRDRAG